jgi:diguanylate cyclase (GGDEF)-like protein
MLQERVLVLDGSRLYATALTREIEASAWLSVDWYSTAVDVLRLIQRGNTRHRLVIVEPELFGVHSGAALLERVLDFFSAQQIPVLLFSNLAETLLEAWVLRGQAIDYVLKESSLCLDQLVSMTYRLVANRQLAALVVDADEIRRTVLTSLLLKQQLMVYQASDVSSVRHMMAQYEHIRLVVCASTGAETTGQGDPPVTVIRAVREQRMRTETVILGVAARPDSRAGARFIKNGADDVLFWPISFEEMLFRVSSVLNTIDNVRSLQARLVRDPVTGLFSRNYIEEAGAKLIASDKRGQVQLTVAMMAIDQFATLVQHYRPSTTNILFRKVSALITDAFRITDVIGHHTREQVCALLVDLDPDHTTSIFERLRTLIEDEEFIVKGQRVPVTASFGVVQRPLDTLAETISAALALLRDAQQQGNTVRILF